MANFVVYGAYDVPVIKINGTRLVDKERLTDLSSQNDGDKFSLKGCYIFSWRASLGAMPIYVGQTTESTLLKEAFNDSNINKLLYYMANKKRGTLQISLVIPDKRKGPTPKNQILEIEEYLIARAAQKNKSLLNIQGTATPDWVIQGIANKGRGQAKKHEATFRKMMGIKHGNDN